MQKSDKELWFITGSQHLYGHETLEQVNIDSGKIAEYLDSCELLPCRVIFKPVLTGSDAITAICDEAGSNDRCAGLIAWMHTFSPAKMWIQGLKRLGKPLLHFHTQFNRDIPWDEIDMDFMNLNQSAHGDREFGHICSRMGIDRKVVVGHWQDKRVAVAIGAWARAAVAALDARNMKIARFGDNMRDVAVTEGNKVSAQMHLNYQVHGYGVGDLVRAVKNVSEGQVERLLKEYSESYIAEGAVISSASLREAARIEAGLRAFLEEGGFRAFTTTFEDLHGLVQLPGLAVQRLMADGYGFGAEGDWKTAALVRSMKVMAEGLPGGTSFMEDYTYNLDPDNTAVLGAHMLEVCPSLSGEKPKLEVHPLGIGGKDDPARLVFSTGTGMAVAASMVEMGDRYRLIVNTMEVVRCPEMPHLPVARVLWKPLPDLETAAAAWIYAGGAHHTGFSTALTPEHLEDFASMTGTEFALIDKDCRLGEFRKELRWNELYYHFRNML